MELPARPSVSSLNTAASSSHSSLRPRHFQYDVLPDRYIRLFKLDLNEENEPLSGCLLTTYQMWEGLDVGRQYWKHAFREDSQEVMEALTEESSYDTVSYTWGDQSETYPLHLSRVSNKLTPSNTVRTDCEPYRNGIIQIGSNLKALLEELRRRKHRKFVWIDAICINQANDMEKRKQIPMMRDIYEYAGHGFIWLGPASPAEVEAINMLPHLTEQLKEACEGAMTLSPGRAESFTEANLPQPRESVWKTIGNVMRHPYWSRLWTLQEAVVSGRTVKKGGLSDFPPTEVFYGETTTLLEVFNQFSIVATALSLRSWIITGRVEARAHSLYAFDGIDEIRTCRESWGTSFWGVALSALLVGTRRRKASIAADVVFGMLAMMDQKTAASLAPEANVTTTEVFVKFAKHYIRNEHKEHLFNHLATEERLAGLPSWCPNFASAPATLSLGSQWIGKLEASDSQIEQMYRAGFKRSGKKWRLPRSRIYVLKGIANALTGRNEYDNIYNTKNPRAIAVLSDLDHLLVSGMHVDIVAETVDCNPASQSDNFFSLDSILQTERWDTQCLRLSLQYLSREVDGFDTYARTITANRVSVERSHNEAMLFDHQYQLDFVERYRQFKGFIQVMKAVGGDMAAEDNLDRETWQFVNVISRVTRQRRFFATEGGRIGLGPADTQVGDAISVIFFCPTPYILRHHPTGRSQLIGETYVHGLMYSEALDMLEQGELDETKWVIE
ncbi:hypothetical protein LTR70_009913 [Exophiala xenobiotica]|uniref:Heterokaryon incompatibility domain-containing protein n=1 Tax=Lithohypha guttulata TaxID=1690604 RepID=A0ABR0JXM2_9EURO|nr:hypothetical protein LTR24_009787 [Lithohypha guttulata]KAK5309887.1 hypothetical protein LTR70_009913 [Exophiala xenobiotica]